MKLLKLTYASCVSAIVSIVFVTGITVWAELAPGLKAFLKSLTGHHWVTKSWGVVMVYLAGLILFYWLPKQIGEKTLRRSVLSLVVFAILGALVLFFFFVWHYLGE